MIPPTPAAQKIVEKRGEDARHSRGRRRSRAGGRRLPPEAEHEGRPVEGRQQHAGRLADVDARAVRHQSRDREGAGLRRRSQREVRRHPAAVRHLEGAHRQRPRSEAQRSGGVVVGVRRRRGGLEEAARVCRERRHAARDRLGGRDRARAARSADREGAARSAAALWRRRRRRRRGGRAGGIGRSRRCATRSAARRG